MGICKGIIAVEFQTHSNRIVLLIPTSINFALLIYAFVTHQFRSVINCIIITMIIISTTDALSSLR